MGTSVKTVVVGSKERQRVSVGFRKQNQQCRGTNGV